MIKSKRRYKAILFIAACGLALGALVSPAKAVSKGATSASQTAPDSGRAIFHQKCEVCHSIGGGDKVGPDLKGVTSLRSVDWLTRWIFAPGKMLAAKDPVAVALQKKYIVPMPSLGLTKVEVAAVIAYLKNPASAAAPATAKEQAPAEAAPKPPTAAAPAPPAAAAKSTLPTGDAAVGELLFTGAMRFHNGGASCMGCHSVAGIGALGGGTMGPDLTPAYGKYKEALLTWPNNVPPMQAIFSANPLTPQEQADLVAFLESAAVPQRAASRIWQLAVLAVIGAILLLIAAQLVWRRRLTSVRESLVRKATKR